MQAFRLAWRPSQRIRLITLVLHLTTAAALPVFFGGWRLAAGGLALLLSWLYAKRVQQAQSAQSLVKLEVDTAGRATVFQRGGTAYAAQLLEDSLIHRQACFLHWQLEGCRVWQCVMPDMADAESYRRLLVWARFGRGK